MKTKILQSSMLIMAIMMSLSSMAQITYTSDDVVREGNFNTNSISAANATVELPTIGANQTWDYSYLIAGSENIRENFDATGDPDFPDASAFRNTERQFQFLSVDRRIYEKVDNDGWYDLGTVTPEQSYDISALSGSVGDVLEFGGVRPYETPNLLIEFPFTFPQQFSNSYVDIMDYKLTAAGFGLNQVPGKRISTTIAQSEVVGYGQLIIPDKNGDSGVPLDALLVKRDVVTVDSITLAGAAAPQTLLDVFQLEQNYTTSFTQYYFVINGFNTTVLSITVEEGIFRTTFRPQATQAQPVVITEDDFDRSGDYIDTLISVNETEVDLPTLGDGQLWDYSHLTPQSLNIRPHYDGSQSDDFPDATGYYGGSLSFQAFPISSDVYERVDENGWFTVGRDVEETEFPLTSISGGPDDKLKFIGKPYTLSNPLENLRFPLNMGLSWNSITQRNLDFEISVAGFGLSSTPGNRLITQYDTTEVVGSGKLLLPSTNGSASEPIDVLLVSYTTVSVDSFFLGGAPAPESLLVPFGLVQGQSQIQKYYQFFAPGYNASVFFIPLFDSEIGITYRLKGFKLEGPKTIFVDHSATGANDGSSWENAFTELSQATESYNKSDEIWVAKGTYKPELVAALSDNNRAFYLDKDVAIYGGFIGDETSREQRDPLVNITILSGDIAGDDIEDEFEINKSDNVNSVVYISGTTTSATVVDGFTITGGFADGNPDVYPDLRGAGLWSYGPSVVSNCIFINNYATVHGGGIYFYETSGPGGAIKNCSFIKNVASDSGAGLTLALTGPTPILVDNCQFIENVAFESGGGMTTIRSYPIVTNSTFINNSSMTSGGGIDFSQGLDDYPSIIENCLVQGNSSTLGGGINVVMFGSRNSIEIRNCEVLDNHCDNFDISLGTNGGGGIRLSSLNAQNSFVVDNCIVNNNTVTADGAGIGILNNLLDGGNTFVIENTVVENNHADGDYGGIAMANEDALVDLKIVNTVISNNSAQSVSGFFVGSLSLNPFLNSDIKLINCLFSENESIIGFVVGFQDHDVDLINCTLADNNASAIGMFNNASVGIKNNIIQSGVFPNFIDVSGLDVPIRSGGGNLLSDNSIGSFTMTRDQVNTEAAFENENYQLSEYSSAIDAGVLDDDLPSLDIEGNARVQGGCIDIGAIESSYDAGGDCSTIVSTEEIAVEQITITPNPATNRIILSSDINWSGAVSIKIYNSIGQLIINDKLTAEDVNGFYATDISTLPSGKYQVLLTNSAKAGISTFIKI